MLPTLALELKQDGSDEAHTVETLATKYEGIPDFQAHLFSSYVREVILPAAEYNPSLTLFNTADQDKTIENYRQFVETVLKILSKKSRKKRVNIFTTNDDGVVAHTAEALFRHGTYNQNITVAARAMVERNTFGHLS